jgi:hypothetical protein
MSLIGRVVGMAVVGMAGAMAVAAAGAMSAKQRIVQTTDPSDDEISLGSIFGPLAFRSTSTNFRGGTIECWYGGGAVDLRDATLAPEGATLTVKAVFGGGQILVPPQWKVVTHVTGVGGTQDSRPALGQVDGAPTLTILGTVVFGGFQVLSELDEGQEDWLRTQEAALDAAAAAKAKPVEGSDQPAPLPDAEPMAGTEPEMTPAV